MDYKESYAIGVMPNCAACSALIMEIAGKIPSNIQVTEIDITKDNQFRSKILMANIRSAPAIYDMKNNKFISKDDLKSALGV